MRSAPLEVAAWLDDGQSALERACAGIEGVHLTPVTDEAALQAVLGRSEVLVMNGVHYGASLAGALARGDHSVRWVQFASAGVDPAWRFGFPAHILLTNAASAFASTVSEHAMALMLGLARGLPQSDRLRAGNDWRRERLVPQLVTLEGQTLVIVGFGAIGRALAKRASVFGMRIVVVARILVEDHNVADFYSLDRLDDALAKADWVALAIALTPQTRHLINARALVALPRHARLINVARGGVVDQQALIAALASGRLAGAGLDVFEEEPLPTTSALRVMDNVLITPHIGGFGGALVNDRLALVIAENIRRYCRGETLHHRVDFEAGSAS